MINSVKLIKIRHMEKKRVLSKHATKNPFYMSEKQKLKYDMQLFKENNPELIKLLHQVAKYHHWKDIINITYRYDYTQLLQYDIFKKLYSNGGDILRYFPGRRSCFNNYIKNHYCQDCFYDNFLIKEIQFDKKVIPLLLSNNNGLVLKGEIYNLALYSLIDYDLCSISIFKIIRNGGDYGETKTNDGKTFLYLLITFINKYKNPIESDINYNIIKYQLQHL